VEFRQLGLHLPIAEPSGERPEALRPYSRCVFASHTIANRSPPTPLLTGSMRPSAALAAIAASTAEPPDFRMSSTDLCRERLARAHHAMLRDDFRTSGKRPASDAIHLGHANRDRQKNEKRKERLRRNALVKCTGGIALLRRGFGARAGSRRFTASGGRVRRPRPTTPDQASPWNCVRKSPRLLGNST